MKKVLFLVLLLGYVINIFAQIEPHIPLKPQRSDNFQYTTYENDFIKVTYPAFCQKYEDRNNPVFQTITISDTGKCNIRVMSGMDKSIKANWDSQMLKQLIQQYSTSGIKVSNISETYECYLAGGKAIGINCQFENQGLYDLSVKLYTNVITKKYVVSLLSVPYGLDKQLGLKIENSIILK